VLYVVGIGVTVDDTKCIEWWTRGAATASSNGWCEHGLGFALQHGTLPKNDSLSFEWYNKSAAKGSIRGIYNVG
jgi:TPR repeat protein